MTTDPEALRRAEEHVFLSGVGDAAEQLGSANSIYGLAKIQHAERELGLRPAAHFIGAPDATVTRNSRRWRAGFGYGGLVRWDERLVVLDARPNGCGMLVGVLREAPDERAARAAARQARNTPQLLDGVELTYDLAESNHFIDGLRLEQQLDASFDAPEHLFLIHSSGHEHRARSPLGPGLYVDESEELRRLALVIDTPWGPISILRDDAARDFTRFCLDVQSFNARRRAHYGQLIFGPFVPLCNATHQGLRGPGEFALGCYSFAPGTTELLPLTLGPDQPVYLLRPRSSFSPEAQRLLGWQERAGRLGLTAALTSASILPHGGGYSFPALRRMARVDAHGARRVFTLETRTGATISIEDARDLPFVYRDLAVLHRLVELDLGEPVARYRVQFVIKE